MKTRFRDIRVEDFIVINEEGLSTGPGTTTANIPNPVETMQGGATNALFKETGKKKIVKEEEETYEYIKPDCEFIGCDVFDVDDDIFDNFRTGKNRYHRWDSYMDMQNEKCSKIYEYAKKNPQKKLILRNVKGAMIYVRPDKFIS